MPAGDETYTPQLADEILKKIADGIPLREICREPGKPSFRTVYNWRDAMPEFAARFARARLDGADAIAAECLEIADDGTNDWIERENARTGQKYIALNDEHVQRSKLRIETRIKLLAKWFPQQYGEKIEVNGDAVDGLAERMRRARARAREKCREVTAEDLAGDTSAEDLAG